MNKKELIKLLQIDSSVISDIEMPKIDKFYMVFTNKEIQKEFKFYLSFLPTNITIDGTDNHNHRVLNDGD